MIGALAFSTLLLLVPGTLIVHALWPRRASPRADLTLKVALGVGLGVGLSSVLLFLWSLPRLLPAGGYVFIETLLVICAAAALALIGRRAASRSAPARLPAPRVWRWLDGLSAGALLVSAACIFTTALVTLGREPHGQGDASAIWNLAARLIFRGEGGLADKLALRPEWSHADYPLLLPLSVVRLWHYAGETQLAPALLALLFMAATLALVVSSVSALRTRTQGYLAGLVLLEPFLFFRVGTYQYADTPLSFYLLATLALFCLYEREPGGRRGLLVLAGLTAGFAAWTKNEGCLFLASITAARLAAVAASHGLKTYLRQMLYFSVGAVPVLLVVLYFKMTMTPANDLVAGQGLRATAERLLDFSRYGVILKFSLDQFVGFRKWYAHPTYLLVVYAWLLGVKPLRGERAGLVTVAVTLGLTLAGYFVIYVTTPRDLAWQLTFSLDRLLMQVWPGIVLLYFLTVRTPEDALAASPKSSGLNEATLTSPDPPV